MLLSKFKWLAFLIINLLFLLTINAENFFNIEYVDDEQGLEDSSIEKIVQDSEGYIWFGTQNGLFKYDGKNSKMYSADGQKGSLLDDDIYDIIFHKKSGQMWIATSRGGMSLYDSDSDIFKNFSVSTSPQLRHYKIKELAEYGDNIWYIDELGIVKYDLKTNLVSEISYLDKLEKSKKEYIAKNLVVFKDKLLSIINNELYFFDKEINQFSRFQFSGVRQYSYTDKLINYNIFNDSLGNLYLYTSAGIFFYDSKRKIIRKELLKTQNSSHDRFLIRDIFTDSYGTVWVVTLGHGVLYKLIGKSKYEKLKIGPGKNQLNTDQVFSIFEDGTNNIWLGTDGFYAAKYRAPQVVYPFLSNFYATERSSHTNTIWTFEEFNNELYLGSDNGVFQITKNFEDTVIKPILNTEKYRVIYDMLVVDDKYMLIGGLNGLFRLWLTGETEDLNHILKRTIVEVSNSDTAVTQLAQSNSHIFIGTFNGLIAVDKTDDSSIHFNTQGADRIINNGSIMSLQYSVQDDFLWVGTEIGVEVISISQNSLVEEINENIKAISGLVNDIHIDQNNSVWLAVGDTLFRYTPEHLLLEYNHFPDNEVRSIETLDGVIWMTTQTGMIKARVDNLEDYQYYVHEDGLYNKGNATMSSYYSKKKNELMFGGDVGFIKFNPSFDIPIKKNIAPKMNEINLLNIEGTPDISELIENTGALEYFQNSLRFEYAYLDYKAPKRNRFQIKLEGFDENWSGLSNKNEATYTNLPGGEYTFRVKAFDANNVQSDRELTVFFTIKKAWWLSDLAYLFYLLGFIVFCLLLNRWQKKEQIRQKNLQLQKNKEEFINGYNRYALSLTELKSHQTLVRKFLDQVRLISGIDYINYQQFIYDSTLNISVGEFDDLLNALVTHELVGSNSMAQIKIRKSISNSYLKVEADVQILFQQMYILQNALIDRQKYNRNDYFNSATGLYDIDVFQSILFDEFERAKVHEAQLFLLEWHIEKSQFKENELLKRIQLLGYGDQIKSLFSGHVLASYSEKDNKYSKFIIFLGEERLDQVERDKGKLEDVISENLSKLADIRENQQFLKIITLDSAYEDYFIDW